MLKAIFFATFDVTEGPKVLHQVPTSSITASPSSPSIPLLHFPPISSLLIPHPTLCNSGLLTLTHSHHRILSYPQHIASPSYPRNAYTFNFCLVLAEDAAFSSYVPVVRKLNALFRTLEEQSQFLSCDGSAPDSGKIYALCEILLEDLNNYSEAMIPIDASNTLNIKLFPTYPPPPPLYAHHVPLATVRLEDLVDENWDLTMLRVLPWIDGVNSVKQIALLADADFKLVRKAISHLLYYGCVLLLDIFSFGAIYAPTPEVAAFVESKEMQAECGRYVALGEGDGLGAEKGEEQEEKGTLSGTHLAELYLSLRQGHSVKSWCMERADVAARIDVRRFITFGVIKGFLYRVHKYALATSIHKSGSKRLAKANFHRLKQREEQQTKEKENKTGGEVENVDLGKYLDGTHCFDEMCTDLMVSEKELTARFKAWGDVQIICR
ncbi:MAG: Nitrogen permease regulator 2 [Alectoria fallacina]|uniref:Nitrogen permease regulator 2 n=1 Tax=Alectoria fallacina TaxID=1903189 RepID=A0A8H3PJE7_9LECA|nr:MAG: Nitrogen permease regulator 2 [Alectoria fallacina]